MCGKRIRDTVASVGNCLPAGRPTDISTVETSSLTPTTETHKTLFCHTVTRACKEAKVSPAVTKFLHDNIPKTKQEGCGVRIVRWISFCESRKTDPLSLTIGILADYLLELQEKFQRGKTVSEYLNVLPDYWPTEFNYIMDSPIICPVLEVAYHLKPQLPELHPTMWDPDIVLSFMI